MKTVYLNDGQEAKLVRKIDETTFIVSPVMVFEDYDGNETEGFSADFVVGQVFEKPPLKKKSDDLLSIEKALDERRKDIATADKSLREARLELEAIKRQKTDLEKLIINKGELREAKRLTIFSDGGYTPIHISKDINDVKFSLYISANDGKLTCWHYKLTFNNWSHSTNFDEKIGILIDKSDEEIHQIAENRVVENAEKIKKYPHTLNLIPDEYLTPELLEIKTTNRIASELKQIEDTKAQIEKQQTLLRLLEEKHLKPNA